MPLIKSELMEILVCPVDKGDLKELETERKLECTKCGRRYPVKEGIPVMLEDEAELSQKTTEDSE
jgi:uncharacterized protein YbaR (Trm112 family)